jgi:hypothetical protein
MRNGNPPTHSSLLDDHLPSPGLDWETPDTSFVGMQEFCIKGTMCCPKPIFVYFSLHLYTQESMKREIPEAHESSNMDVESYD